GARGRQAAQRPHRRSRRPAARGRPYLAAAAVADDDLERAAGDHAVAPVAVELDAGIDPAPSPPSASSVRREHARPASAIRANAATRMVGYGTGKIGQPYVTRISNEGLSITI